ncbi:HlyD family secretion protein [Edaphobacter aggregans]|uniref:HlyD family secretion protein n=1 Tax=Edaphobacter aggregans TaxID=570835 RepID=A0A428MPA4_9BACT|nr:efflux RND transporter periplasmic adaptor subunit [Edaphobacter aggregans]RSL18685.1 HlyD family secretion protein [Edaphobacter aggregans]
MKRTVIIGIAALAVLIVAGWLIHSCANSKNSFVYSGTIETREIQIGSKIGGRVIQVLVEEGQAVKAGTLLVQFEFDDVKAQRAQAQAQLEQAQADYHRLQRGNRPEEIAQAQANAQMQRAMLDAAESGPRSQELKQAEADYDAAKTDAANAQINFQRMDTLVRGDTVSRQQYDNAKATRDSTAQKAESLHQRLALLQAGTRKEDLQAAQERYHQAQAAADLMKRGYRKEDIDAGRAKMEEAQAHVDQLDVQLKEANLFAPADGLVQTVSVRTGDLVGPGKIVVTMLESSQLWVKVYVPETDLSAVRVGQSARVEVDSLQNRPFTGNVQEIAAQAEFLPRNVQTRDDRQHQVFGVKVRVDNPDGALKSGMSATVRLQ